MKQVNSTKKNSLSQNLASKICCVGSVAVQLAIAVFFGLGTASLYGKTTNVLNMINSALGIFNMGKSYARSIFSCIIAILYFVLLGLMIKDIYTAITILKAPLSKDNKNNKTAKDAIQLLKWQVMSTFLKSLVFMVAVGFINSYKINVYAILSVLFGILLFLAFQSTYFIYSKHTLKSIIFNTVYIVIFILIIGLLIFNTQYDIVERFAGAVAAFASGFGILPLIFSAVSAVTRIIIACYALKAIDSVCSWIPTNTKDARDSAVSILCSTGVYAIIPFAESITNGNIVTSNNVFDSIFACAALLLAGAALLVFTFLPKEDEIDPAYVNQSEDDYYYDEEDEDDDNYL